MLSWCMGVGDRQTPAQVQFNPCMIVSAILRTGALARDSNTPFPTTICSFSTQKHRLNRRAYKELPYQRLYFGMRIRCSAVEFEILARALVIK
jgi:hypothetical protein